MKIETVLPLGKLDPGVRAAPAGLLGLAYWAGGDLEPAHQA